jgi:hypothetical protein
MPHNLPAYQSINQSKAGGKAPRIKVSALSSVCLSFLGQVLNQYYSKKERVVAKPPGIMQLVNSCYLEVLKRNKFLFKTPFFAF